MAHKGHKIQFLTLCILICGVAIPIAVIDLQKIGHSSQKERIAFFTKLKEQFNFEGMILLADREYIGLNRSDRFSNYISSSGLRRESTTIT